MKCLYKDNVELGRGQFLEKVQMRVVKQLRRPDHASHWLQGRLEPGISAVLASQVRPFFFPQALKGNVSICLFCSS